MRKNLLEALLFGILYVVIGTFMQNKLKVEDPIIYAGVYFMLGLIYGIL